MPIEIKQTLYSVEDVAKESGLSHKQIIDLAEEIWSHDSYSWGEESWFKERQLWILTGIGKVFGLNE